MVFYVAEKRNQRRVEIEGGESPSTGLYEVTDSMNIASGI